MFGPSPSSIIKLAFLYYTVLEYFHVSSSSLCSGCVYPGSVVLEVCHPRQVNEGQTFPSTWLAQ